MAMTKDFPTIQLRAQTNGSFQGAASKVRCNTYFV
ncbi:hypothetical protein SAMN05446927_4120 [Caballeronia arationis]|jgi:hypothetical protein|uniref:Uncharacterized protein n=1 Tax=Caballeronia arationis TaxID=1777142 RepID=A0A7Z7I842_9BURK|nr:hypothetical protein SAMN05446927_4120 [Caballeronia arationis]